LHNNKIFTLIKVKPSYTSVKGAGMSVEAHTIPVQEQKPNDKEINFRAFEAKKNKELEEERAEKLRLQKELEELRQRGSPKDEDDDAIPYIDQKRLNRELNQFGKKAREENKSDIQQAVDKALYEERKQAWLDNNPDFFEVMEKNTQRFMEKAPEVAKTILSMPDNFERAKLVFHSIKTMGIDKPEQKTPSIQEKIDANRRSPFYQPPSMGTAPYAAAGDFSESGMKNAYDQMQKLKAGRRG